MSTKLRCWFLTAVLVVFGIARAESGTIKDTESASHGGNAAACEIVDTYQHPGFGIVEFDLSVLSHYSYILAGGKDALVVDPGRDVQVCPE